MVQPYLVCLGCMKLSYQAHEFLVVVLVVVLLLQPTDDSHHCNLQPCRFSASMLTLLGCSQHSAIIRGSISASDGRTRRLASHYVMMLDGSGAPRSTSTVQSRLSIAPPLPHLHSHRDPYHSKIPKFQPSMTTSELSDSSILGSRTSKGRKKKWTKLL